MNKEIKNKIINETVDTIIDSIYEVTQEYMYEFGNESESSDEFIKQQEMLEREVIKELYKRRINYESNV